jgi:glycerophosphoryl diester phosphodiesterase
VKHAFFHGLRAPLHISHRGGAALLPENTLPAFEAAVRLWRTDVLEIDIQTTRDGELVVAHDETVDRCTDGVGLVSSFTWAELSQLDAGFRFSPGEGTYPLRGSGVKIPRLVDVLRLFPTLRFNIELKTAAALDGFVELVRTEKAGGRICAGSEHDDIASMISAAMPEALLFYPRDALTAFILPMKSGEPPIDDDRFTVLDMPLDFQGVRLFDAALRDEAARRGKWINVWTIDDPHEMREVIGEGVGGVMTDRPDLLREVMR